MTDLALIERITRSLAYMLRHQPEQFDLELDPYGFAEVEEVVRALNERLGEPIEEEDLRDALGTGDRQRYELKDGLIRALYGHSIEVEPGEPVKPPEWLYVGVSSRDADRAGQYGLRGGRRRFLHLALSEEDAVETGRRVAKEYAVIGVRALEAWEEGINFYDRKALFLSEPIPTRFLEVGEVRDDGIGMEERPSRGDARGPRGPRSRGGRGRGEFRAPADGGRGAGRRSEAPRDAANGRGGRRGDGPGGRDDGRRGDGGRGEGRQGAERRPDRERPQEHTSAPARAPRSDAGRPEPPRPIPKREEPAVASNFGSGIFDAPAAKEKPENKAPRPAPPREPEPQPAAEPSPTEDTGGGSEFGAGL